MASKAEWGEPKAEPSQMANEKQVEAELNTSHPKPCQQPYL